VWLSVAGTSQASSRGLRGNDIVARAAVIAHFAEAARRSAWRVASVAHDVGEAALGRSPVIICGVSNQMRHSGP